MPIDPSIILGYKPAQIESPLNALGDALKVKAMQQQGEIGALTLDEHKRTAEENRQTAEAYKSALNADGTINRNNLYTSLAQRGLGAKLPTVQKGFADQDKAQVDSDAAKFKLANDRYSAFQKTMGALKDAPNLSKELLMETGANLVKQGILPREMYDGAVANMPDDVAQLRQRLTQGLATQLPPEKVFELFAPKPEKFDNGATITVRDMNPNSPTYGKDTGGAPIVKEQTPGDVSAHEDRVASRNQAERHFKQTSEDGKTQIVQSDNGPVLVNKVTGTGKAVTGPDGQQLPGVTKPLTEGQSKALLFGTRAQESHKVLDQLAAKGTATSVPGSRAPVIGGVVNALSSTNQQMLDQAKRDFMTAVLRRESGAAISSGEFETADKQYFPQIGETDPKVIAQKKRNRELAIKGILAEVPEKQRGSITPVAPLNAGGPTVGAVEDGHRFKGGNPANPKNWEKV